MQDGPRNKVVITVELAIIYLVLFKRFMYSKYVAQLCSTLCDLTDYTVRGIFQTRILKWVAIAFSRGFSQPRNRIQVSHIAGGFFDQPLKQDLFLTYCLITDSTTSI